MIPQFTFVVYISVTGLHVSDHVITQFTFIVYMSDHVIYQYVCCLDKRSDHVISQLHGLRSVVNDFILFVFIFYTQHVLLGNVKIKIGTFQGM